MAIITKNTSLGWGLGGLVASLIAFVSLGQSGCSDSSAAPSGTDAAADAVDDVQADALVEAGPPPPLGVPTASCAGCPVCGGVLGSPTTGISYCTIDCTTSTDCPTGTACVANTSTSLLSNECLATCTTSADCTAPFICRADLSTPGSYCWSPYPAPDGSVTPFPDASVSDAGVSDAGTPADTGAPSEAGVSDASPSDASDAGDGG